MRDPITKYTSDKDVPSERNNYNRVVNDRDQEIHTDLENKHGDPKKKRGERRNSFLKMRSIDTEIKTVKISEEKIDQSQGK